MNLRNNRGITGTDISVALVVIVLFVSLVSTLVYNFSVASKSVNRKSVAVDIAVSKIEEYKSKDYEDPNIKNSIEYRNQNGEYAESGPYKVTTNVTNYADSEYAKSLPAEEKENIEDVIKIVTVTVEYSVGTSQESVELSTVITKGD